MTRTVVFHKFGSADVLQVERRPLPSPGKGEVLLKVGAIGINHAEILYRQGRYLEAPRAFPAGLGFEAAGVIQEMGQETQGFKAGDKVATLPIFSMRDYAVYGEHAVVPVFALARYPEALAQAEAAAVWMAGMTAYGGLIFCGELQPRDHVVISAAGSSIGLAAIQIAKYLGATVIATTRSPQKKDALLKAGADHVIVTTQQDLTGALNTITNGNGVQVFFDAVGGTNLIRFAKAAAFGARIVIYGTLATEPTLLPLSLALQKCLAIHAYRNMDLLRGRACDAARQFVADRLQQGSLSAWIDRVFPFDHVVEAHAFCESGAQVGKVVLLTEEDESPLRGQYGT